MLFRSANFGCFRPIELSPQVQPIIATPGHATFPMGHAVQAYAVARVLDVVSMEQLYSKAKKAKTTVTPLNQASFRLAHRIGWNRVVAGVHFPVDLPAGAALGVAIADGLMAMCGRSSATFEIRVAPDYANILPWTEGTAPLNTPKLGVYAPALWKAVYQEWAAHATPRAK